MAAIYETLVDIGATRMNRQGDWEVSGDDARNFS